MHILFANQVKREVKTQKNMLFNIFPRQKFLKSKIYRLLCIAKLNF